jgi:xylulokinase
MGYLLGVDAGTTAVKAILFDENGTVLANGTEEYSLITPADGIVESDPAVYWNSFKSVLKQIFSSLSPAYREITALAFSSQGESFITIDSSGVPLRNTIVWMDSRSQKQARKIADAFGSDNVYHTTGSPEVDPIWASTKLLWMRENEPELFKKIHKVLFVEDYLIYRLTERCVANGALWCSSLLYDINKNIWWDEMLDFIGLNKSQLPELCPSGIEVGKVNRNVADELGFSNAPAVVSGGMDQACGCIGSGNISTGIVTVTTGTSLNVSVTVDHPVFDPLRRVPCQTHALPGKYIYLPWCSSGGLLLKWFRNNFCEYQTKQALDNNADIYDILTQSVQSVPPGSEGLIILPHLTGAMSPEMDPNARGVVFGLNLATKREHFVRAIMESVAYMLRANIQLIQDAGISMNDIILTGGASQSDIWNQIMSDVLGKEVKTIKSPEAGCVGAAILAGLGTGIYSSADDACRSIIQINKTYRPNTKNHEVYQNIFETYRQLYSSLKPIFPRQL